MGYTWMLGGPSSAWCCQMRSGGVGLCQEGPVRSVSSPVRLLRDLGAVKSSVRSGAVIIHTLKISLTIVRL
jgi:hypothetical protein